VVTSLVEAWFGSGHAALIAPPESDSSQSWVQVVPAEQDHTRLGRRGLNEQSFDGILDLGDEILGALRRKKHGCKSDAPDTLIIDRRGLLDFRLQRGITVAKNKYERVSPRLGQR
jgi:hypothetical protein